MRVLRRNMICNIMYVCDMYVILCFTITKAFLEGLAQNRETWKILFPTSVEQFSLD